jgi:hypothetical protein
MENFKGYFPMLCKDQQIHKNQANNQIQIQIQYRVEETQQILHKG